MKNLLRLSQQLPPISVCVLLCAFSSSAIAAKPSEAIDKSEPIAAIDPETFDITSNLESDLTATQAVEGARLVAEQSFTNSVILDSAVVEPTSQDVSPTGLTNDLTNTDTNTATSELASVDVANVDIANVDAANTELASTDLADTKTTTSEATTVPDAMSNVPAANPLSDRAAMDQVTSVTQLSDVQPTDWAYQALQSLVERYGVIAGYPDGTYRGNRAMTRYEFAAGLNAALDRVNELIAAGLADAVTREDLATLQRLQEEFAAELATLRGRTDALEARTAELEANQFSTTTVLFGETIFGLSSVIAGDDVNGNEADRIPTFGYRVRLNLETSFTGEDALTTRLQASNIVPLSEVTGTNEGRIEYDGDSNDVFGLGLLRYRFPIGPNTTGYLAGRGNGFVDLDASQQLTPYYDGSAVSLFALRNPIYNYSFGTGFGLRHLFGDTLELNLGYLVPDATDPEPGGGLFNGKYGALAQLIVYPTESIRIGFSYINSYSPANDEGFGLATGSNLANDNFDRPVTTNAYGVTGTVDITPGIAFTGWVGYSNHRYIGRGDGTVWNWAAGLAFPDLGNEGSIGGILVGMEPRLTEIDATVNGGDVDDDVSLHLEAFYRYRLSDNIEITPGVIWLTAPDHDADNEDLVVGVVRTVFRF